MEDKKLTLLVDGNNMLIRGFLSHGIRRGSEFEPLRTSDGRVSSGVFGVLSTLRFLVKSFQPDRMIWIFDSGKSKKRLALFPEYKSDRPSSSDKKNKMEGLSYQFGAVDELLSILGVASFKQNGVEADDLLASASRSIDGIKVIVSADHDLRQLVSKDVLVYKPSLGQSQAVLYDEDKIREEYELEPRELPYVWAVMGDKGDSIPGVRGFGLKTARKSFKTYGGFSGMILNDPKLRDHESLVYRNYRLINLLSDDEKFPFSSSDLLFDREFEWEALREFLEKWEFNSVINEMKTGKGFWE